MDLLNSLLDNAQNSDESHWGNEPYLGSLVKNEPMDLQQPSTSSDYRVAHTYDTNRQNGHFSDESSKQETDELSEHSLSQENLAVRNMQSVRESVKIKTHYPCFDMQNGPLNVNKQNWNWTLASSDNIESSSRLTSTHPSKFNITVVPGWLPEGSVTCEATSDATIGQLWSALAEQIGMHTKYLQLRHLGSSTILDDGDMTWAAAGIISGSRIRVDIMILCAALKPFSLSSICAVNSAVRPEISHGNDENVTITVDAVPLDTMDKTNHVNDVQRRCSKERGFSPNVHPDETYDERRRRKQREEKRRQRARKAAECRLIDAENLRRQMAIRPIGMNGNTPTSNGNMNPMTHFGEICDRRSVKRVRAPSPNAPADCSRMNAQFLQKFSELVKRKKYLHLPSAEEHEAIITAIIKKEKGQKLDSYQERNYATRFTLAKLDNETRIFKRNKLVVNEEQVFDILQATHIRLGHAGRDNMLKNLHDYYGITKEIIEAFLAVCNKCVLKRSKMKQGLVINRISKQFNEGCQDMVDLKVIPDGD